jgi:hypothetical protein
VAFFVVEARKEINIVLFNVQTAYPNLLKFALDIEVILDSRSDQTTD